LALVPLAVGINLAMGQIVSLLALPVYLDTVGTVLVAALAGPWAALATGLVSQLILGLFVNSVLLAFLLVQLLVAVYAGVMCCHFRVFRSAPRAGGSGLVLGILAASASWPISLLVFGGVTSPGVTLVTAVLGGLGLPLRWAVYVASLATDIVDKTATFLVVYAVLSALPGRLAGRFPAAARARGVAG